MQMSSAMHTSGSALVFAGEFTDLRGPRIGVAATFGLIAIVIIGLAGIARVVSSAVRSEGRRRWSWAAMATGIALILLAAVPLLVDVDIREPAVKCGRPLLSRDDLDTSARSSASHEKAMVCQRRLDDRRRLALGLATSGSLFVVAATTKLLTSDRTDRAEGGFS